MDKKQYTLTVVLSMLTGLLGGVVSSWFLGSGVAEVIKAKRFEVVDKDGKRRAELSLIVGEPFLRLNDKRGQYRVELGVVSGGYIGLVDQNSMIRVGLGLGKDGEPGLSLYDKNGKGRAALRLNENGEPGLRLNDKNGKSRALLGLLKNGEPYLALYDKNGKPRASLRLLDGEPLLALADKNDKLRAVLGHIGLEATKTGETRQRPVGSLVLFDEGKVIWQAP